jgi:hypothetical protein
MYIYLLREFFIANLIAALETLHPSDLRLTDLMARFYSLVWTSFPIASVLDSLAHV